MKDNLPIEGNQRSTDSLEGDTSAPPSTVEGSYEDKCLLNVTARESLILVCSFQSEYKLYCSNYSILGEKRGNVYPLYTCHVHTIPIGNTHVNLMRTRSK